eukprot:g36751.t1
MICQYPSMDPLNCSVVLSMEMMRLLILQWMDRVKLQCHAVMVIRRYCLLLFFNRYFIYSVMLKMVFVEMMPSLSIDVNPIAVSFCFMVTRRSNSLLLFFN